MKRVCVLISVMSLFTQNSYSDIKPLLETSELLNVQNSFFSAKTPEGFGFTLGVSETRLEYLNGFNAKQWKQIRYDSQDIRSISATVYLPIHLNFGLKIAYPQSKLHGYEIDIQSFLLQLQIDPLFFDHSFIEASIIASYSNSDLKSVLKTQSSSLGMMLSGKLFGLSLYTKLNYSIFKHDYRLNNQDMSQEKKEFRPNVGFSFPLLIFYVYAETMQNEYNRNIFGGIVLVF